jgi:predicted RNase H-like HicB family nuclease
LNKTYKVVVEPDEYEDGTPAFHVYCPALKGARTHGKTREEALKNIREVVQMVAAGYIERGRSLPPDIEVDTVEVPV